MKYATEKLFAPVESNMTFREKAQRYYLGFEEPNFCFGQQNSVAMTPVLTVGGMCFGFNVDDKIFDRTT